MDVFQRTSSIPNNRGYVQGKSAISDTWNKSGKPYGQIRRSLPTEQSGHSRLIISVPVKFQSTPGLFLLFPGWSGGAIQACLSLFSLKSETLDM
ncbi:hypothetical protein TNIN_476931 [Trichonephila inaurata madagascariensis]|uniref:Uncharacterized protein n=1 Tax=Trichonephila inaurata madagascariensis TaxID=2747483 RepID=A0A8X7BRN4_9ARAC|nr:hypothetical protein TNIN_476931 [Trichonephila inaurata madagascariensis]